MIPAILMAIQALQQKAQNQNAQAQQMNQAMSQGMQPVQQIPSINNVFGNY